MSSSDLAISIRNLSKSYRIAHNRVRHSTLAEAMLGRIRRPFQRAQRETFWALKDVSFDVKRGEVVGIIGRNGAGKSTLLKILSRITEPTEGQIDLYGRIGSLLEVGTGFHQELTGRENIFLNGAILGMRRAEIQSRFDEIVEFAGVSQFLDTPVKRYSSGMYVRLAFAVAAHLNPEILIVDEVLAVGDSDFQKKCLGKMKDVATGGRTVLFVSHNMSSIQTLCDKGVFLKAGRIMRYGPIDQVISEYLTTDLGANGPVWRRENLKKNPLSFTTVSLQLCGAQPRHKLEILAELESFSQHKPAFLACDIAGANGTVVLQALPALEGFIHSEPRTHRLKLTVDLPPLIPGLYNITMWVGSHNNQTLDLISRCAAFEITESPTVGRSYPHHAEHGYVVPDSEIRDESQTDAAERPAPGMTQHAGKD